MLAKTNRLKKERDFGKILRSGKKFREDFLLLRVSKNDIDKVRFGISVSKKVSKKATLRNKLKRRLASLLAIYLPRIRKGTDLLFITLPGMELKTFPEIKETIGELFKKSKVLQND